LVLIILFCWNDENLEQISWSYYLKNWQKLLREIEQFQIQYLERVSANNFEKRNISNYESFEENYKRPN
jgi:hypothetical protein